MTERATDVIGTADPTAILRPLVPVTRGRAYLFSGGIAPGCTPVLEAMDRWLQTWAEDPLAHRSHYWDDLERCRASLGRLLRVEPADIALTSSTSLASNLAMRLVEPVAGSNVVIDTTTYASSRYPWQLPRAAGVEVRRVGVRPDGDLSAWADAVDERTLAVVVSHVDPDTGDRHDLEALGRLARGVGARLIVDAAQSVGAIDVDPLAMGVDALVGVSMKWLLGPPGIGFLWARPDLLAAAPRLEASYTSAVQTADGSLAFASGGRALEHGVPGLPALAGFAAALDLVEAVSVAAIERRISDLAGRGIAGLVARGWAVTTPADPRRRAGVIVISTPDPGPITAALREAGVDIWGYPDRGRLRVDVHAFNDDGDIDRLLAALDDLPERVRP